jgi:hypothetical protein
VDNPESSYNSGLRVKKEKSEVSILGYRHIIPEGIEMLEARKGKKQSEIEVTLK